MILRCIVLGLIFIHSPLIMASETVWSCSSEQENVAFVFEENWLGYNRLNAECKTDAGFCLDAKVFKDQNEESTWILEGQARVKGDWYEAYRMKIHELDIGRYAWQITLKVKQENGWTSLQKINFPRCTKKS